MRKAVTLTTPWGTKRYVTMGPTLFATAILAILALAITETILLVWMVVVLWHVSTLWGIFGLWVVWITWKATVKLTFK